MRHLPLFFDLVGRRVVVVGAGLGAERRAALARALGGLDIWCLTALSVAVGVSGSLVIGLALLDRRLDPGGAFEAAELESTFEIEKWGEDMEATARRADLRAELGLAARFLSLLD